MASFLSLSRPCFLPGLGAITLLAGLMGSAQADITVVSQVAVTETDQPDLNNNVQSNPPERRDSAHSPQTVTTYYKGGNARTEMIGGPVMLFHGDEGKVYTLDPAAKTYYVRSVKDTEQPAQPDNGPHLSMDSHVDVKTNDGSETIDGRVAQAYTVSGTITLSPQRREGGGGRGGFGGHHRGGGGFPGGGGGFPLFQQGGFPGGDGQDGGDGGGGYGRGRGQGGGRARTLEVSGEVWLSDSVKLPDDKKASVLPALDASFSGGEFALKTLTDDLGKKKEIPLKSRLSITRTDARTAMQDTTTTDMSVSSVSSAPLSDTLFQLPLGYTQVAAPDISSTDSGE